MKKVTWVDRLRYAFDNTLAAGPLALIGWLGLASALVILLTAVVIRLVTRGEMDFLVILWDVLFQALTPNPVAPDAGPLAFLLAMFLVTMGSLFMVSILIGVLTTTIEERIHSLRKGRSQVLENGHTVILGWDEHILTIMSELAVANQNQPRSRSCIAVLAQRDKVVMEDEIREIAAGLGHTRVVCRSGDPLNHHDLEIVSLNTARAVIVLAPDDDDPDASVIKTVLAIVNNPERRPQPYHIVAEIHDPANMEAAQLVGGDEVRLVLIGRLIAHIIAQTCRRSGLSTVYTELLNFAGDEIYFQEEPALVGRTFGEALSAYEDSAILGLHPKLGQPKLNPPMDTCLRPGDRLIAISEDDDTVRLSGLKTLGIEEAAICQGQPAPAQPERMLVIGWNWRTATVIRELDHYVAPGSLTTVAAEDPAVGREIDVLRADLKNQTVEFVLADTTERQALAQMHVECHQHVVVMAYSDTLPIQKADARTLVTLLHLREVARGCQQAFTIVSEMLDEHNRDLAEVTHADDFIVSGKLASLMLAQVAENSELLAVFEDLFGAEGSEIYFKPAAAYVALGQPVNFYTVLEAARRRGEVAIGYRLRALASDANQSYGVIINPDKSQPITFSEPDRIVVLAEAE